MSKTVGYGIIGCGAAGAINAKALRCVSGARLVSVYDTSREKSDSIASEYDARSEESIEALVHNPDVDAVVICTPSGLHYDNACAAIKAQKHVVCEKPLDTLYDRACNMLALANQAHVRVFPVLQKRLLPDYLRIKKAIENGVLGTVNLASVRVDWYRSVEYYTQSGWRGSNIMDGGVLLNQGIHALDMMLSLMPKAVAVRAMSASTRKITEAEDVCIGAIRFENGTIGSIEITTVAKPGLFEEISFYGSEGAASLRNERLFYSSLLELPLTEETADLFTKKQDAKISTDGHAAHYLSVTQAIREHTAAYVKTEDELYTLKVICALRQAAASGIEIDLDSMQFNFSPRKCNGINSERIPR